MYQGTKKNTSNLPIILGVAALLLLSNQKDVPKVKAPSKANKYTKKEFIDLMLPYAKAVGKKIGVPYLFILAQIIIETRFGNSSLFYKYNNIGGVKAVKGQPFISLPTYEYIKSKKVRINQNFAVYNSLFDGVVGYAKILQNRYFKKYLNKTTDPKKYAILLQSGKPKYATDINYVPKIHKLIDSLKTV